MLFALGNLWMARKRIMSLQGEGAPADCQGGIGKAETGLQMTKSGRITSRLLPHQTNPRSPSDCAGMAKRVLQTFAARHCAGRALAAGAPSRLLVACIPVIVLRQAASSSAALPHRRVLHVDVLITSPRSCALSAPCPPSQECPSLRCRWPSDGECLACPHARHRPP